MKKIIVLASLIASISSVMYAMENENQPRIEEKYIFEPQVHQNIADRITAIDIAMSQQSRRSVQLTKELSDIREVFRKFDPSKYVPYYGVYLPIHNHLVVIEKAVLHSEGQGIAIPNAKTRKFALNNKGILKIDLPPSWQQEQKIAQIPPLDLNAKGKSSEKDQSDQGADEEQEELLSEPDEESQEDSSKLKKLPDPKKQPKQDTKSNKKGTFSKCLIFRFLGGGALAVGITAAILYYFLVYKNKIKESADVPADTENGSAEQLETSDNNNLQQEPVAQSAAA